MMNLENFIHAKKTIASIARVTPLTNASNLVHDFELFIKMENLQLTGSFKLRGALYKLSKLTKEQLDHGVIAASAGNHAQGVALAATQLGVRSIIVMPESAPLSKVNATRNFGSEVKLYGATFNDAYNYAKILQEKLDMTFIEPFDDFDIIAGQGTIALEIFDQYPLVDVVFVPIGGGGLAAGIATCMKLINPKCLIYGVEAEGAPSMKVSFENNEITTLPSVSTIADGIAVKKPGDITYSLCKQNLDGIVTVSDDDIAYGVLKLLEKSKIVAEGAGATSIAAALTTKEIDLKGKKVLAVLSGGNVDVNFLSRIIDRALIKEGRKFAFNTIIVDRPGQLNGLLAIISQTGGNIVSVNHDRTGHNVKAGFCNVEIILETFDHAHIQQILQTLKNSGYTFQIYE